MHFNSPYTRVCLPACDAVDLASAVKVSVVAANGRGSGGSLKVEGLGSERSAACIAGFNDNVRCWRQPEMHDRRMGCHVLVCARTSYKPPCCLYAGGKCWASSNYKLPSRQQETVLTREGIVKIQLSCSQPRGNLGRLYVSAVTCCAYICYY